MQDALTFLRSVWPDSGPWYCIAQHILNTKTGNKFWRHETFSKIEDAAAWAVTNGPKHDTYFTMHTLKQKEVWDPNKGGRDGRKGKMVVRVQTNTERARCFYLDLDVGKEYKTQTEALAALKQFLEDTGLPMPHILASGIGFHLFWPLVDSMESSVWKETAVKLGKICLHNGFMADPARTSDNASVLRLPQTWHLKDRANPRPVSLLKTGKPTDVHAFVGLVDRLMALLPSATTEPPVATDLINNSPTSFDALGKACAQLRWAVRHAAEASEPQWYHTLNLVRHVDDGNKWAHLISKPHPDYTPDGTDAKLVQLSRRIFDDGKVLGPTTCSTMAQHFGPSRCDKCWYKGNPKSSPIVAARRLPKAQDETIAPVPTGYTRLAAGGVSMSDTEGEGEIIICPVDLYPTAIIHDPVLNRRAIRWHTELPKRGVAEFSIPSEAHYNTSEFVAHTSNAGIMLEYDQLKYMRQYMIAYIASLQRHVQDKEQRNHLGWDADFKKFVLPDGAITARGVEPVVLSNNAQNFGHAIRRAGTLEKQVELLKFYADPKYVRQQFYLTASLAASIFYMTGHHGFILNATGDPGAGKSTTLYAAAGLWGHPKGFTINGTADGATNKARAASLAVLANLPVCVDEITLMSKEDAQNMAMSVSQPNSKVMLQRNGEVKKSIEHQKSTIMMTTSNNSVHELLSRQNVSGTASSMRVFEIYFLRHDQPKFLGDTFLMQLNENFGHIGPAFMDYVMHNQPAVYARVRAVMREIETMGVVNQGERYWGDGIACIIVAGEIVELLHLLPFKAALVRKWALEVQLPSMREVVSTSYTTPIESLGAFLNTIATQLLVVKQSVRPGQMTVTTRPHHELAGRFETDKMLMYISIPHFRSYCVRQGISFNATINALKKDGIATTEKFTLGKHVEDMNFGQTTVLRLDLNSRAVSGTAIVEAVNNVVKMEKRA